MRDLLMLTLCGALIASSAGATQLSFGGTTSDGPMVITNNDDPDVAVFIGKLSPSWNSCKTDEDCAVAYMGCQPTGVNTAHAQTFAKRMLSLGFKVDPSNCVSFVHPDGVKCEVPGKSGIDPAFAKDIDPDWLKAHPEMMMGSEANIREQCVVTYPQLNPQHPPTPWPQRQPNSPGGRG